MKQCALFFFFCRKQLFVLVFLLFSQNQNVPCFELDVPSDPRDAVM